MTETRRSTTVPITPSAPPPAALVAVDRAVAEVRRGGFLLITAQGEKPLLVQAAETCDSASLERLSRLTDTPPALFVTRRRAAVLGLPTQGDAQSYALQLPEPLDEALVGVFADPGANEGEPHLPDGCRVQPIPADAPAEAAVLLTKVARLLPAVVGAPVGATDPRAWAAERNIVTADASAIVSYQNTAARSLKAVGESRVPLLGAEEVRIIAFRPSDGGIEHLAIVIGQPDPEQPAMVRLHSECFTGDLLGSLRCDCGDQLRGAIDAMAAAGSGILLYLAQEGRGIGLVNKLRAYKLQDAGYDTMDANGQLGFDDDERIYLPAAEMLRQLGFTRVRLMTNNPLKVDALARHGIVVEERVPHVFTSNAHNLGYLRTKATKGGHLF